MLAQRFHRMMNPIRYAALDPAHAQAIYNFLRMQSRVYGIPEMMGTQQTQQMLGSAHPLGVQMAQQIHHGDNEAAMVLPDMLEDHGMVPLGQPGGSLLLQLLQGMRTRMGDHGQIHGYGQAGHEAYANNPVGGQNLGAMAGFMGNLTHHGHAVRVLRDALHGGDATAMPAAADTVNRIGTPHLMGLARRHAASTLNRMNDFMSNYSG